MVLNVPCGPPPRWCTMLTCQSVVFGCRPNFPILPPPIFCRTYDAVEFKPGPRLNVIIGPNGTGKSTIVCAICLGLAGKTNVLGRAANPAEFIKHNKQTATIELEL